MKKTTGSKTVVRKIKRPLKPASANGLKMRQTSEPGMASSYPSEEITIPTPKRISPAADEEME